MSRFQNNSIFWVEVEKISPNPYQPRREFDEDRLKDLAESIRQYGILQPLTVTRKEKIKEDGGISVEYELIAGERRHRASKIAGLSQVPVIIRSGEENSQMKLELAIIENLQREDINAIERARAFARLAEEFDMTHAAIGKKVGKSREYVSNSIRLLGLPDHIQTAIMEGKMTEGHGRPILMLKDRPEEQETLYKEVIYKKLSVRDTESIARRVAQDKVRKKKYKPDPEILELEKQLSESLGTRVQIEKKDTGGKIVIDFFSSEDVQELMELFGRVVDSQPQNRHKFMERFLEKKEELEEEEEEPKEVSVAEVVEQQREEEKQEEEVEDIISSDTSDVEDKSKTRKENKKEDEPEVQERSFSEKATQAFAQKEVEETEEEETEKKNIKKEEEKGKKEEKDEELYSISNFTV
ncbi:MAG: ParB/RepB/Spo0J family partition protein [Candidatus Paceibacterota bacterium]